MFRHQPVASDLWVIAAAAVLQLIAGGLALAETSLTRMTRIRALHLEELKKPGARPLVLLVEIPATVDEATKGGEIEAEEREMIHSIFEFGDTILREVMVPRPDVVAVPLDSILEEVLQVMLRTGYSRIPVYE